MGMDIFDLVATLSLDSSKYENGLKGAENNASSVGSKIGGALGTVAKAGAAAVGAMATGVTALATSATNAYADFEQLSGGIETLFGDATEKTMANAEKAFKTAGLSMNEYMETAIQSSASMITSLGGDVDKASDMIDLSITDMADNVNKMGTTMEAVQNAYRGFSRGNFTMLDNLALGFAGTKEGMQELIDKANELRDAQGLDLRHLDINSYADIVQAIHEVQNEMGITGTTALEASQTISGSLNSLKSAWTNVLTGIADENADFDSQIDALVESTGAFVDNIIPRIEVAINGVGNLISKLAPKIAEKLPKLISKVAPSLITAVVSLFESLMSAIPKLIPIILDIATSLISELGNQLPTFIKILSEIVVELINGLSEALPIIIPVLIEAVLSAVQALAKNLPTILASLLDLVETLVDSLLNKGLPILLDILPDIITSVIDFIIGAIPKIILAITEINSAILKELPNIIEMIVGMIPEIVVSIIQALVEATPDLVMGFVELFSAFVIAVPLIIVELVKVLPQLITAFIDAFTEHGPELKQAFVDLIPNMLSAFSQAESAVAVQSAIGDFFIGIGNAISNFFRPAIETMLTIWNWFANTFNPLINAFKELISTVFQAIEIVISRIWKKTINNIIEWWTPIWEKISPVLETIKSGIETAFNFIYDKIKEPLDKAKSFISDTFEKIKGIFNGLVDSAKTWGLDLINNFIAGIQSKIQALTDMVRNVSQTVKDFIGFSEPKKGPLSNFHTFAPDMMELFAKGVEDNEDLVAKQIAKSFDFKDDIVSVTNDRRNDTMASRGFGDLSEVIKVLMQIRDKEVVKLSANMDGIFDAFKEREDIHRKATGYA